MKWTFLLYTLFLGFLSISYGIKSATAENCIQRIQKLREHGITDTLVNYSQYCVKAHPKNDVILHYRALVLMESGKPGRATVPLRHAISLRPEIPDNYLILLRAYLESKDVLKRWGRVTKVLKERFRKSPEVLLNAGNLLIHYSKLRTALDYFNDLLHKGLIEKWIYHLKLGQMYLLLRRYEDARKELEVSIVANPGSALTLYYLGRVWKEQGNQAYMLSYFKHAMKKGLDGEPRQYVEKALKGLLGSKDPVIGSDK